VPKAVMQKNSN